MQQTDSRPAWRRSRVRVTVLSIIALAPLAVLAYNLAALIGDAAELSAGTTDTLALVQTAAVTFGFIVAVAAVRSLRQLGWWLLGFLAVLAVPTVILYSLGYRPDIT